MKGIADTGFLVAFLNRRDAHHAWACAVAETVEVPLLTVEAVLAEAAFHVGSVQAVMRLIPAGLVQSDFALKDNWQRVQTPAKRSFGNNPSSSTSGSVALIAMIRLFRCTAFLICSLLIGPLGAATTEPSAQAEAEPHAPPQTEKIRRLDPTQTLGRFDGFGIGIHPGDVIYPEAFDALDLEYVRLEFGPVWADVPEPIPEDATDDAMLAYIRRNYNADAPDRLDGAKRAHDFLRARGIQLILIHFELPYQWRVPDGNGRFDAAHIEDLARFYTAHLRFLQSNGIELDYIELANEPDGHWNGHLPPEDYARLVQTCARQFAAAGLEDLKILGPGLAFLNLHGQTPAYLHALEVSGADQFLDAWSTHTWDEVEFQKSRVEYAYGVWQPFLDGIQGMDLERTKPLFVTEYGSDVLQFADRHYASPRDNTTGTVLDSWDYALRVIANSIAHLNRGANALVLYRLSNAHWHGTGWGTLQPTSPGTFEKKPVFRALETFMADLPVGWTVLKPIWYRHDDPIVMSALHDASSDRLELLFANTSDERQQIRLELPAEFHASTLNLTWSSEADWTSDQRAAVAIFDTSGYLHVELPPASVARLQLNAN